MLRRRNRNDYEKIDHGQNSQEICIDESCGVKITCVAYKFSKLKCFLYHSIALVCLGLPYLLVYWYHHWVVYFKCYKSPLSEAQVVLLKYDDCNEIYVERVVKNNESLLYFVHHHLKFVWNSDVEEFILLKGLDRGDVKLSDLLDQSLGLTVEEQNNLLNLHGKNQINVEVKSYRKLFVNEVFHPFYIFQVGSMILWSLDEYYIYAGCVFALSLFSVVVALIETRKQSLTLQKMVSASNNTTVHVSRRGKAESELIPSANLVPGDIIVIPPNGCLMTCDAILLVGYCIVNESMLTGESVPVTKTPPSHSDEVYNPDKHKRHTLFCGTQVIQTRFYGNEKVLAVVARTGFSTAKGELVRSILFPKPMGFKFYQDSIKFICVLFGIATFGMAYCIYVFISMKATIETIVVRTLDILTIVVPPALPAAMTVGTVYAQSRLRAKGIFCISPPRINICGKLKLICFDKTGTLTEDCLDLWGVIANHDRHFDHPQREPRYLPLDSPLAVSMAVCHSLTLLEGQLTGDPLDLRMFESTHWVMDEPGKDTARFDLLIPTVVRPSEEQITEMPIKQKYLGPEGETLPYEVGIIRQFPFSSDAQCMSVIARTLGEDHMSLYCKGAPEKIQTLCVPDSVPSNFHELLIEYASNGFRVLAIAYKPLKPSFSWRHAQRVKREQVETDLQFLGLLVMKNNLKIETMPVIQQLHHARLRLVMITGDNLLTAVSVSRECGLVPPGETIVKLVGHAPEGEAASLEFEAMTFEQRGTNTEDTVLSLAGLTTGNVVLALEGRTWAIIKQYFPSLLPLVLVRGAVFARMSPDQKSQLVEELQHMDYVVAMCGDGANDCGALKAAHIGVSLSEAEASVAAPFTSQVPNISCMVSLVQEGRCALVTSFGIFKFMALYSITQFISVLILYSVRTNLGDMQFLYIDLIITTSLAVVMGRVGPSEQLVAQRPPGSLASLVTVLPLLLQIALTASIQYMAFHVLHSQPWFKVSVPATSNQIKATWDNTVIFCVSSYQYLILATAYSKGAPHRKQFYTNGWFLIALLLLAGLNTVLLLYPVDKLADFFQLMPLQHTYHDTLFRFTLLWLPAINLVLALLCENIISDSRGLKALVRCITRKKRPRNKYKVLQQEFEGQEFWSHYGEVLLTNSSS